MCAIIRIDYEVCNFICIWYTISHPTRRRPEDTDVRALYQLWSDRQMHGHTGFTCGYHNLNAAGIN